MKVYEARELFLSQFSTLEIVQLIWFIKRRGMSSCPQSYFPQFSDFQNLNKLLFGISDIRNIRMGNGPRGLRYDLYPVIKEIPRLKKMVADALVGQSLLVKKESPAVFPKKVEEAASKPTVSISLLPVVRVKTKKDWNKKRNEKLEALAAATPPLPTGLTVSHRNAPNILVTAHAWERFVKRYCRLTRISKLGWYAPEHFANKMKAIFARSVEVQLSSEGVVRRLINNDFIPVRYFLDRALQLRFVVKESYPVLFTVEIATRK